MPPVMVWTRKKDTSEEMSYLVDYTSKLSNLFEDLKKLDDFAQYIENQGNWNVAELKGSVK